MQNYFFFPQDYNNVLEFYHRRKSLYITMKLYRICRTIGEDN